MALLVKKFGGTSVGNINKIKNIAKNISKSKDAGNDIVVVVSAMGHSTDDLNNLAYSLSAIESRAMVTCSPVERSISSSLLGGVLLNE